MFSALFHWLRTGIRNAILQGIADAADAIDTHASTGTEPPALPASILARLSAAPPQADEAEGNGRRKKVAS